jgi:hypothetical protein
MQAAALLVAVAKGILGGHVAYHCVLIIMQAAAPLAAMAKGEAARGGGSDIGGYLPVLLRGHRLPAGFWYVCVCVCV